MKRLLSSAALTIFLAVALTPTPALAESKAHHDAIKLCRQKYKNAVRGAKYLKSRQRNERIEQARKEREECERLAPK